MSSSALFARRLRAWYRKTVLVPFALVGLTSLALGCRHCARLYVERQTKTLRISLEALGSLEMEP